MIMEMKNSSLACCRELFRQTKIFQEQAECIVPDVFEDIGQIASAEAQLCLKGKELTERGAYIEGRAEICVFYITEDRARVRCVKLFKDFQADFGFPSLMPEAIAQVSLCSLGVQARAVNPRKIAAALTIRAELSCWAEETLLLPFDVQQEKPDSLLLRQESAESLITLSLGEKSFVVSEQLPLGASFDPSAIVCSHAELLYTDHQIIGSKALIKGGVELRIGFESPESLQPSFTEQCVPFSVLIDMPEEDCVLGQVSLVPTALYTDLSDAINGSRVVELEVHGVVQYGVEKKGKAAYLSDAYSTRCPVAYDLGTASLCSRRERQSLTMRASESISAEGAAEEAAASHAEILSFSAKDGKAAASVSVSLLLRSEDGSLRALQRLLSFEESLPDGEGEITAARIVSLQTARVGEEIRLDAALSIDCVCAKTCEIRYLTSLELDTEHAYDPAELPSLMLVKKGERELWEIAKLYHSSPKAIEKLGEKFPMEGDRLLVPRI